MDDGVAPRGASAFAFEGSWREFAPIAFTNLLLIIVTLGIYRFWATARARRYLWSRSRFVDEHLEWTGTGKELFFGFLLVMLLVLLPFFVLTQVAQAMIIRGHTAIGALMMGLAVLAIYYLGGVARFRALRYRLSRTNWRGIRGGSDDQGLTYGLSYMWKNFVGTITFGLIIPWSMASLWNERWGKLSFGPFGFEADAQWRPVFARFLLFYLAPVLLFVGLIALAGTGALAGYGLGGNSGMQVGIGVTVVLAVLFFYLGLGLIAVAFYAKFYREALGALRWRELEFSFGASTMDWVKLLLGDVALVVLTLGIGLVFLTYRHWKFLMVHLDASGEILLDELTQSTTRTPTQGEGLLDAFDIGAI